MKFRNKKTGDVYVFVKYVVHSETLELMVEYYKIKEGSMAVHWVRPAALFLEKFEAVI